MKAYSYKELKFSEGFLDFSVDITYILTMNNSIERHKNIKTQLNEVVPTSKVVIVYNQGYKKIKKVNDCGIIDRSYDDLTHAVTHIFDLAEKNNYNRILILEDDFIFDSNRMTDEVVNVNNFIINNQPNLYSLGCINYSKSISC